MWPFPEYYRSDFFWRVESEAKISSVFSLNIDEHGTMKIMNNIT